MTYTRKITALVGSLLLSSFIAAQTVQADSVQFTASVPNGQTAAYSLVLFSLSDFDNPGYSSYEVDISPGMTGHNVVTSMDMDMDLIGPFDGIVAGNTLTVEEVCQAEYIAAAEVGMSMNLDTSGCYGVIPPQPDFPLTSNKRRDEWAHIILIGDVKAQNPVPVKSTGYIGLTLIFQASAIDVQVPFDPSMTTADIANELDKAFARSDGLDQSVVYVGLDRDGLPTFESRGGAFSIRSETVASQNPDFYLGAATLAPSSREDRRN